MSTKFEAVPLDESKKKEKSDELKTAREEEQVFGERLLDDLMNTFCDKLQKSAQSQKNAIDGFLAIQYITNIQTKPSFWEWLCCKRLDMESTRKMISGERKAIQIIYDSERVHYVLLYLNSRRKIVLYDSLISTDIDNVLTKTVREQIVTLFGHLYPGGEIPVLVEINYEHQTDDWSCGYRALACATNLARGEEPAQQSYDLAGIYRLLIKVLDQTSNEVWPVFYEAEFSRILPETRIAKTWHLFQNYWNLTLSMLRGREEDSSKVSLLLRSDLSYDVTDSFNILKKKPSQTNTSRPESTQTAKSPSAGSLDEEVSEVSGGLEE